MPNKSLPTPTSNLVISTPLRGRPSSKGQANKPHGQRKAGVIQTSLPSPVSGLDTHDTLLERQLSTSKSAACCNDQTSSISANATYPGSVGNDKPGREPAHPRSKLSQVSEVSGTTAIQRTDTETSKIRKRSTAGSVRRVRHSDGKSATGSRRPPNSDGGRVTKRQDHEFKVNPSLLSVLTSLTATSDRSSGSNTTVTQGSYHRRSKAGQTMSPTSRTRRSVPEQRPSSPMPPLTEANSVFQYMDPPSNDERHDDQSDASSSSGSEYEASDAGSSEQPDTPSSRSTFPSPAATRSGSISGHVAEMRRKYDARSTVSGRSVRGESISTETAPAVAPKQAQVDSVVDTEYCVGPDPSGTEQDFDSQPRSSSRLSSVSQQSDQHIQQREEAMRQHMAYAQAGQYVDPAYAEYMQQQYIASMHAMGDAPPQQSPPQMALQHYQHPAPPAQMNYPTPPHSMTGHMAPAEFPPAPDAPDLSKRTLAGYEKLALELSNSRSSVKPVYRRFDYLHHRLLLHIQDEMCELEEQLRLMDEIIAQTEAAHSPDASHPPSSRRGDANSNLEIHHRRTALLGHVFLKQEQYSRAMTSYASINKEFCPAEKGQVDTYKAWLAKQSPIHEDETKFLQNVKDLVLPGVRKAAPSVSSHTLDEKEPSAKQLLFMYMPYALLLPLLLFSLIPTFGGRLIVTALIAFGGSMVVTATQLKDMMLTNEWAVCGGAYVLLMTAIAGCIP